VYSNALLQAPADIKRLMAFAPAMNVEFIVGFFGNLSRETSIEVMKVSTCNCLTHSLMIAYTRYCHDEKQSVELV
jgi:hypothetical protein